MSVKTNAGDYGVDLLDLRSRIDRNRHSKTSKSASALSFFNFSFTSLRISSVTLRGMASQTSGFGFAILAQYPSLRSLGRTSCLVIYFKVMSVSKQDTLGMDSQGTAYIGVHPTPSPWQHPPSAFCYGNVYSCRAEPRGLEKWASRTTV